MTDTEDAGLIARAFAQTIWQDRDFALATLLIDPLFRLCMAQQWIWDNWEEVERAGLDRDRLAAAVSAPAPTHPLWTDFMRVQMRAFDLWPRLSDWGVTTTERLVQPGLQLIFWVEPGTEGIPGGELFAGYPCLLRKTDAGWRVVNLYSQGVIPEPGWPPRLNDPEIDGSLQLAPRL